MSSTSKVLHIENGQFLKPKILPLWPFDEKTHTHQRQQKLQVNNMLQSQSATMVDQRCALYLFSKTTKQTH